MGCARPQEVKPEARGILEDLVRTADIVVRNCTAGTAIGSVSDTRSIPSGHITESSNCSLSRVRRPTI
jgi:hypothetical protein